ncbi:MAG: hypothetical protein ACFFAS_12880 [Promethearchaeota archaeon]
MDILCGWKLDPVLNIFRIPIRIINPITQDSVIRHCLFDTGFSGYAGLSKETITSLKLERVGRGKGVTVSGIIDYNNYIAMIEIVDQEEKTVASIVNKDYGKELENKSLIPVQEFGIPILGIKAIIQFSWLIESEIQAILLMK